LAGISGNIFFYNFLRGEKISVQNIITIVIVELLTFYVAAAVIILVALAVYLSFYKTTLLLIIMLIAGVFIYALFGLGITLIGKRETVNKLCIKLSKIKSLRKHADKLKKFVSENNSNLRSGLPSIIQYKQQLVPVAVLEAGIFLADMFTVYALFHGLGVFTTFSTVFVAFILAKIISLLPISPGALIVYESGLTFFLVKLGAPVGTAVIVTLLFRVLSFWLPIPAGFLLSSKLHHERYVTE